MTKLYTKRIQSARDWCAIVKRDCAYCIHFILPLRRPGPPVFFPGWKSCDPAAWLAECQLLAGDIVSNPGPKQILKTFYTHSLNPTHSLNTLIHQSNPLNPPTLTVPSPLTHLCPIPSAPSAKHTNIPQSIYSNCTHVYTSSNLLDLWMSPGRLVPLLDRWKGRLAGLP